MTQKEADIHPNCPFYSSKEQKSIMNPTIRGTIKWSYQLRNGIRSSTIYLSYCYRRRFVWLFWTQLLFSPGGWARYAESRLQYVISKCFTARAYGKLHLFADNKRTLQHRHHLRLSRGFFTQWKVYPRQAIFPPVRSLVSRPYNDDDTGHRRGRHALCRSVSDGRRGHAGPVDRQCAHARSHPAASAQSHLLDPGGNAFW